MRALRGLAFALCGVLGLLLGAAAQAAELPTFRLECNNGVFTPKVLRVPAGVKFKIEIHNTGTQAIEFESVQLRKEKALASGGSSFVVIFPLDAGEYKFFDDFHLGVGEGSIVVK